MQKIKKKCVYCGSILNDDRETCPNCGGRLVSVKEVIQEAPTDSGTAKPVQTGTAQTPAAQVQKNQVSQANSTQVQSNANNTNTPPKNTHVSAPKPRRRISGTAVLIIVGIVFLLTLILGFIISCAVGNFTVAAVFLILLIPVIVIAVKIFRAP